MQEVENFAEVFRRQVLSDSEDFARIARAMDRVRAHSQVVLPFLDPRRVFASTPPACLPWNWLCDQLKLGSWERRG